MIHFPFVRHNLSAGYRPKSSSQNSERKRDRVMGKDQSYYFYNIKHSKELAGQLHQHLGSSYSTLVVGQLGAALQTYRCCPPWLSFCNTIGQYLCVARHCDPSVTRLASTDTSYMSPAIVTLLQHDSPVAIYIILCRPTLGPFCNAIRQRDKNWQVGQFLASDLLQYFVLGQILAGGQKFS